MQIFEKQNKTKTDKNSFSFLLFFLAKRHLTQGMDREGT